MITLTSKPGKFFTKATSIEDRYDNRDEDLQNISLSQFSKRITKARKNANNEEEELFEKGEEVIISEENKSDEEPQKITSN